MGTAFLAVGLAIVVMTFWVFVAGIGWPIVTLALAMFVFGVLAGFNVARDD
jgi:hypothetical protein